MPALPDLTPRERLAPGRTEGAPGTLGGVGTGPSTAATAALDRLGIAYVPRVFAARHAADGDGYGLEAARALGVEPARVLKTIVVAAGDVLAVGVVPVSTLLDLRAVAAALGVKRVAVAEPALAERRTGYVVGGISPIGQRTPLPVLIDASAAEHATVLVSGGRRGFDVELAPADLLAATDGRTVAIAR